MNRRKFLGIAGKTIISAAVAPAIVRAESIMRIKPIVTLDDIFDISPLDTPFVNIISQTVEPGKREFISSLYQTESGGLEVGSVQIYESEYGISRYDRILSQLDRRTLALREDFQRKI